MYAMKPILYLNTMMNWKCRLLIPLLFSFSFLTRAQSTIQLFNRKDLSGWYAFEPSSGKHENASNLFKVDQKMIRLYGNKLGYLMTQQSFRDFKLTAEFRWNIDTSFIQKSGKKNSGLMYLIPTDAPDTLWPKGIQF